jgi:hypothetical protein
MVGGEGALQLFADLTVAIEEACQAGPRVAQAPISAAEMWWLPTELAEEDLMLDSPDWLHDEPLGA